MWLRFGIRQWEDYVGRGVLRLMIDMELDEFWELVSFRSMVVVWLFVGL